MTSAEFANNRDNFCYRHPDRQSFVLCQRCLRTICPECQTQAAVGVICPECMRDQQKATPRAARAGWRRPRAQGSTMALASDSRPLVTWWIVGVSVVMYLLQVLLPGQFVQQWLAFFAPLLYPQLTGAFEPWRLLTYAVLHASFLHIALNMLALWMMGRSLEPLLGHARFLILYVLSALGGSVFVALIAFGTPVVGASGAIFGMFGAYIVIARHLGADVGRIAIVIGINLVIGFLPGFQIAWQAHIGGLIAGAVVGFIYTRTRQRSRRRLQTTLLATVAVVLLALLLIPLAIYR